MTPAGKRVVLVAAVADNGVIGVDGDIPWRIPEDFAHFKATTMGHTLLMGRATYESIGRPLPGRITVVLTRDPSWSASAEGVRVAPSLESALDLADELPGDVMVVGGATVYADALSVADEQILTEVHQTPAGDTFYPPFDTSDWVPSRREAFDGYDRVWWVRADTAG
jgi:dihydrofolate reductase